ncbi:MAG: DUF2232 domain-containing protein [Clostridiaceae bacterium]
MSENNLRQEDNRQWLHISILFLLVNIGIIFSQGFYIFAALICPVYLAYVYTRFGWNAALLTGIAGLLPYALLGGPENLLMATVTFIIMTLGHILILKLDVSPAKALMILGGAAALSIIANTGIFIYIIEKTDLVSFFNGVAKTGQNIILSMIEQSKTTLPESQKLAFKEVSDSITPRFIIDQSPAVVIQYGITIGYLGLRLAKRFLKSARINPAEVPYFSEIKINPLLLFFGFIFMLGGMYLDSSNIRSGSILFHTGYGLVNYLGIAGGSSLIWWFMTARLKIRNRLFKVLGILSLMFFTGINPFILLAIIDSVLDFRNLSGKSLYNYIKWMINPQKEE